MIMKSMLFTLIYDGKRFGNLLNYFGNNDYKIYSDTNAL